MMKRLERQGSDRRRSVVSQTTTRRRKAGEPVPYAARTAGPSDEPMPSRRSCPDRRCREALQGSRLVEHVPWHVEPTEPVLRDVAFATGCGPGFQAACSSEVKASSPVVAALSVQLAQQSSKDAAKAATPRSRAPPRRLHVDPALARLAKVLSLREVGVADQLEFPYRGSGSAFLGHRG